MYRRIAAEESNATGIYTVRTMAQFDFPAKEIFEFIWDLGNRRKFDGYIKDLNVIVDIKDELEDPVKGMDVLYASFSMPFPLTARDFVHIRF